MGQEIDRSHFRTADFEEFTRRLKAETALLKQWLAEGRFGARGGVAGFELEAWLTDADGRPAPINEQYLRRMHDPLVVAELARFNVELNADPQPLTGAALRRMHAQLDATWARCGAGAAALDARILMVGILPTLRDEDLSIDNMSGLHRYHALNEQVLRQRAGKPLTLDIQGHEHLKTTHYDVMLESAATSFQIHLQIAPEEAVRYFNAATVIAAPMVAVAANSPYLFGRDLWDETRIPLFEQSVAVGGPAGAIYGPVKRVTFGSAYLRRSLMECFDDNVEHYPVLLPILYDAAPETLSHLRLHNGTIWRWNRPLIGFDGGERPHLRLEHRVVPGGPSVIDEIANSAFFYGLSRALAASERPPEQALPFSQARDNFYGAARQGLNAHVTWLDGERHNARRLVLNDLLPLARAGLDAFAIDADDRDRYLGVIEERARTGRTGAAWQRAYVSAHGRDMARLTKAYAERQRDGAPVHEWDV